MTIYALFPKPVYFSKLERTLTKEEVEMFKTYKKKTYKNIGNRTSSDKYVLENKTLKNLKKDLSDKVVDYFNEIICTSNTIVPYITQSWLSYTKSNQFHHLHTHSNSYISGVFYISADKKVDQIKFYKLDTAAANISSSVYFKPMTTKYNMFNVLSWWYPVQTGDIILFPSSLSHGVDKKKGNNIRTSLSFNVFFKGTIGNKLEATELILR
jgi:uncharacterized protein (TIGR02466 family)